MLDNKHFRPCLNVSRATGAEVEVKPGTKQLISTTDFISQNAFHRIFSGESNWSINPPGKVHFSEVFAVVHVEEVVEVSCPAEGVDHPLITQSETWQHLSFQVIELFVRCTNFIYSTTSIGLSVPHKIHQREKDSPC